MRLLPDFIIIGAQRCGTTSLFNNLAQHPAVYPSLPKEVHYFSIYYDKSTTWYRSHFPLARHKRYVERNHERCFITGEATPYYIAHPHAPLRVFETVPQARLIVLLRNPVDRAYSHYHFEVKKGIETLSFEEAIAREEARLSSEVKRLREDKVYRSFNHMHYTYLSRGIYADQLVAWKGIFKNEQILILDSESFYEDPAATFDKVTEFLNLKHWRFEDDRKFNVGGYQAMNADTRKRLIAYFEPHNERLHQLLGVDFDWDR
jgi:hypothetical protein